MHIGTFAFTFATGNRQALSPPVPNASPAPILRRRPPRPFQCHYVDSAPRPPIPRAGSGPALTRVRTTLHPGLVRPCFMGRAPPVQLIPIQRQRPWKDARSPAKFMGWRDVAVSNTTSFYVTKPVALFKPALHVGGFARVPYPPTHSHSVHVCNQQSSGPESTSPQRRPCPHSTSRPPGPCVCIRAICKKVRGKGGRKRCQVPIHYNLTSFML